jgi:hypothetical protein
MNLGYNLIVESNYSISNSQVKKILSGYGSAPTPRRVTVTGGPELMAGSMPILPWGHLTAGRKENQTLQTKLRVAGDRQHYK